MGSEPSKIRARTQTGLQFCGLPIGPVARAGQTSPKQIGVNSAEGITPSKQPNLPGQAVHVPNVPHNNRKAGAPGQASHETHPMIAQEPLEGARITGKGESNPKDTSPSPSVVDHGGKCSARLTPGSFATHPPSLYRCLKQRLECSQVWTKKVYTELQSKLCNLCEDRSLGCKSIADFLCGVKHNLRGGQPNI